MNRLDSENKPLFLSNTFLYWTHRLLKTSNTASIFQSITFYEFFSNQPNTESFVFTISENEEIIASVFGVIIYEQGIKKNLTKRAIIYGGPLVDHEHKNVNSALSLLLSHLTKRLKGKAIYIETRNLNDYSIYNNIFLQNGFSYEPYVNYNIDISDIEKTLMNFKSEKRRQIRKSLKSGVQIEIAKNKKEIVDLYDILFQLYNNKVKKPLPDLKYFTDLFDLFKKYDNGFVSILVYNEKIIGGSFCPIFKDKIYDWYRCGLDNEYKNLYPSTLSVYAGMFIGNEKGCKLFDFMGAGNINVPYGVREFKSQFGGTLIEQGRYLKVLNKTKYKIGKIGLSIMQKIKNK
jgi:lipid II:glycine glycyltransferase (peptidoglycan interpeptide bridge formation enzyme)